MAQVAQAEALGFAGKRIGRPAFAIVGNGERQVAG